MDELNIYNNKTRNHSRIFRTKSSFFAEEVIIKLQLQDNKIIFTKPNLDYIGKTYKFSTYQNKNTGIDYFSTVYCVLPSGKYLFDADESTEDMLIVYCK